MLRNKVVVITGAASGIGEAAARLFVREGARVVLGDIQADKLDALAAELGSEQSAVAVECNVAQEPDVERLVSTAVDHFGGLDVMCNNAGIVGKLGCAEALMENANVAEFDRVNAVNLRGVFLGTKHAARAMKAAGARGCIINTTSIAGLRVNVANAGDPMLVPAGYVSSKHGVIALTKLGACELAPYGIRVNAVAPGSTATPMVASVTGMENKTMEDLEQLLASTSVMKGVAIKAEDVANGMLYLASDVGRCVNGHTLTIDCCVMAGVAGYVPALNGSA